MRATNWTGLLVLIGIAAAVGLALLKPADGTPLDRAFLYAVGALAGGFVLHAGSRSGRSSLAAIERQCREASERDESRELRLERVDGDDLVSAGWNRVVARVESESGSELDERLAQALAGLRDDQATSILNSLPDGIAVTDAEGRITFANPAFKAIFGRPDADVQGEVLANLLPEGHGFRPREGGQGQMHPSVGELQRSADVADGVLRVARFPLDGSPNSANQVWCIRDITQQRLAEAARDQFVHSATHELRTPLANIKAYAETLMLSEELDPQRQREFYNVLNSEATRLARFVDDLLDVSRMEAGSMTLDLQQTDVERLLTEIVEKVRPQMVQKEIVLETTVPPKLPELRLDKDKIAAALVNLLGNAAKYTPEGGRVKLVAECDGREVRIHIDDTGIGIAADELALVGTKFFRSADPRVRDVTGSGLGLSFAQEAVRLHGGRLSVTSELNRGSRFTIALPVT